MLRRPRGSRDVFHIHGFFVVRVVFYIVVAEAETESLGHFWKPGEFLIGGLGRKGAVGGRSGRGGGERWKRSSGWE